MKSKILNILTGSVLLVYLAAPVLHAQGPNGPSVIQGPVTVVAGSSTPRTAAEVALPSSKKEGVVRVGVAIPIAQMGQGVPGSTVAEPLRVLFLQHLAGPTLEAIPIAAVQPTQVDAEAKANNCDYILYSSLSQKRGGGAGLSMLRNAAPMLSMVPMFGAAVSIGGMIAARAASVALAGGLSAATAVKAKSELTLAYKLFRPGAATPVFENSLKAKARTDGEDVITPLLSQAVANTLGEIAKQK